MHGEEMGVLHQRGLAGRAFHVCWYSKLLLFMMFPALSLLLFPLLHPGGALVLSLFESFSRVFEGSASVFLLLNGVVVTIIASSKMEQSSTARGPYASGGVKDTETKGKRSVLSSHEQYSDFEFVEEGAHPEESMEIREEDQYNNALIKEFSEDSYEGEQDPISTLVCSAEDREEDEVSGNDENGQEDAAMVPVTNGATSGGDGDGDDGGGVGNLMPSEEEAPSADDVWAAIMAAKAGGDLEKACNKCLPEDYGRDDAASTQPENAKVEVASDVGGPAALTEEAPSAEEVWAAIISEKNGGAPMKAADKGGEVGDGGGEGGAVANVGSEGGATATGRGVKAERPPWKSWPAVMGRPRRGQVEEDLDRRAEEFIARFNERMRLQRLESLRRRRAQRRRGGHRLQRHHSRGSNCAPRPSPAAPRTGVAAL